jgi:hypothetical protein
LQKNRQYSFKLNRLIFFASLTTGFQLINKMLSAYRQITYFFYKKGVMEYVLEYPKSSLPWYRVLMESIDVWWMKRQLRNFVENDLLID